MTHAIIAVGRWVVVFRFTHLHEQDMLLLAVLQSSACCCPPTRLVLVTDASHMQHHRQSSCQLRSGRGTRKKDFSPVALPEDEGGLSQAILAGPCGVCKHAKHDRKRATGHKREEAHRKGALHGKRGVEV